MHIRSLTTLLVAGSLLVTGCNSKQKAVENINSLQQQVDSIFSIAQVLTPEQRLVTNELVDAYIAFADKHADDENAPAYLFEAARLKTAIPDYQAAIDLFNQVVERYPESEFAPRGLLSIGGIYDVTLSDYEAARKAYERLNQEYPTQAAEYGVPMILETLGQDPDAILRELLNQGGSTDTMDISEASVSAE
jgi:tetratricopeptide (TPR) repeat protein